MPNKILHLLRIVEDNKIISIDVKLENDTVWLNLNQLSDLFERDKSVISRHLKNIYKTKELKESSTIAKFATVQTEGGREIKRDVTHYNLDAIISVGYRVNSKRATKFRKWATKILKSYLVEGYALNVKRLVLVQDKWRALQIQMQNLRGIIDTKHLTERQSKALIKVITDYSQALELITYADNNSIPKIKGITESNPLIYDEFILEVNRLRKELNEGQMFGQDNKDGLRSVIKSIEQSFGGKPLYRCVEEKAANLMYLIIKNHPFIDGNKRIGSFAFVRYLDLNGILYKDDGQKVIEQDTLVAIALLLAQSKSTDKDLMIDLVMYLIGRKR